MGKDDAINYTDWVMATSDKLSILNLKFAFKYFDKKKTGMIGVQEISDALNENDLE